ncbi:hypothetical protein Avbf_07011 [Armadillidium vulgare]|nr:hypothetical protein Avbf_07011 [Armadillidium vulgare]
MQVFHESMTTRLYDRLLYIVCSQNWENMGPYYWIKQCIELLLVTAKDGTKHASYLGGSLLIAVGSIINAKLNFVFLNT